MIELEEGSIVDVEWNDGTVMYSCLYIRRDRGFILFVFDDNIVAVRPQNIKKISESI